jgi:hypothetical protein
LVVLPWLAALTPAALAGFSTACFVMDFLCRVGTACGDDACGRYETKDKDKAN